MKYLANYVLRFFTLPDVSLNIDACAWLSTSAGTAARQLLIRIIGQFFEFFNKIYVLL
jgi:hypothetical protein